MDYIPVIISKKDIIEYAIQNLEDSPEIDLIAQLISFEKDDYQYNIILNKLVRTENVDYDLQIRKWRVVLVDRLIEDLPQDPFEGLIELTEFWASLGFPRDCPHIIQGRNNSYTPIEYYTEDFLKISIKNHIQWIKNEVKDIIFCE